MRVATFSACFVMGCLQCLPVRSDSGGGWESWVYSLTPEQLCEAYMLSLIHI